MAQAANFSSINKKPAKDSWKYSHDLTKFSQFFKQAGNKVIKKDDFKPQIPDRFARKQLIAKDIAQKLETSAFVLVVRGKSMSPENTLKFRNEIKQLGFLPKHVKNSTFIAAHKFYLTNPTSENTRQAESFTLDNTTLLLSSHSLLDAVRPTGNRMFAKLKQVIPFLPINPTDGAKVKMPRKMQKMPWRDYRIVCGYIVDSGKTNPYVWLDFDRLSQLFDDLEKLSQHLPAETPLVAEEQKPAMQAHDLFHGQLVSMLEKSMSTVIHPLEQHLQRIPDTLESSVLNVSNTLEKVATLRETEAGSSS